MLRLLNFETSANNRRIPSERLKHPSPGSASILFNSGMGIRKMTA
jgi:hypothetical protein